ncbi:MAG: methyltransferase type 12, partial [Pyrinomonadaceae bacterium]
LFIVDFYDQRDLPGPFRRFLKWWLEKFHVKFWPELMPYLESLDSIGDAKVTIIPLFRRYSFIARLRPSSP